MAVNCSKCDKSTNIPFKCKYCGDRFCVDHRLPESHDCLGLAEYKSRPKENIVPQSHMTSPKNPIRRKKKKLTGFNLGGLEGKFSYIILGITILMFILQMTMGRGFTQDLYFNPLTIEDNPWMFVTSMFLHGDFNHLLVNMLMLFFFGTLLERKIGSSRFLFIYFLSGIIGNIGYLIFTLTTGSYIPALGASGALYGVFATLAIIDPSIVVYIYFFIPLRIIYALGLFAIFDILILNVNTGIASAAHLAGVLIGLIYGFYLKRTYGLHSEKERYDLTNW